MWNQNVIKFLVRQKFIFYKIYYIYVYKSFSAMLDKGLRKNIKKIDGEIGKHKLNEMGALNIK